MSSGFVSGGTSDAPIQRSDEWLTAQKEIEANRQRKLDEQARQSSGRSLFETLEANKAAKQDAFEEANRLKNQFRALDEDEIDFLDSVLESTRAEEERVKRETKEGLALFRKQQEDADKKARKESGDAVDDQVSPVVEEEWVAGGRKRKRVKDKEVLKGVKIRRASTTDEKEKSSASKTSSQAAVTTTTTKESASTAPTEVSLTKKSAPPPSKGGSGLVSYGSDSDDD